MSGTLDVSPKSVRLIGYAGDTLPVTIKVPTAFIAGRTWTAQVRASFTSTVVDATFVIITPTEPDGPASLYISAADTARLATLGSTSQATRITGGSGEAPVAYTGVWDCQLSPAVGPDPTTTLAYGQLIIKGDVTRITTAPGDGGSG